MLELLDYANLQIGDTQQGECPTCGKRKFYVTRKANGYAFICFRASCPTQGFSGSSALPAEQVQIKKPYSRQYTGELFPATDADIEFFNLRFGIDFGTNPNYWLKATSDDRYAFPLWGPADEYRGLVIRRPNWANIMCPRRDLKKGTGCPKTICYFEEDAAARSAWYHSMDEETVVLVEDCVSAMRIADNGFTAVALLGTDIRLEHIRDFQKWKNGARYILALDPDATCKALKLHQKWNGAIPGSFEVAILKADPKDYDSDKELLQDLRL